MRSWPLFSRFGVELEYMLVDGKSLDISPTADRLMAGERGGTGGDVERGGLDWSNELVLHVLEIKTAGPHRSLTRLASRFQVEVRAVNSRLAPFGLRLLPTAMHPWMDPLRETRLWPHECGEIYAAFNRIFDCRGHGWSNVQSTHLNLPFAGDAEFARLHTAIRLLLPIMPALAAASPIAGGRISGFLDTRLEFYRRNCQRIPSITGRVIPEKIQSQKQYERVILSRLYEDLRPHDPDGTLREEWVNARGAIARFTRGTIEIRVLDIQECPAADLAILQSVVQVLRGLIDQTISEFPLQGRCRNVDLERVFLRCIRDAERAVVGGSGYFEALGFRGERRMEARDVWRGLLEKTTTGNPPWWAPIQTILREGCLARRLLKATGAKPSRATLREIYQRLGECLEAGRIFLP